jgi:hypothetical protein
MRRNINSLLIVLTFAFGIMLASSISTASVVVFAQQKIKPIQQHLLLAVIKQQM